MDNEFISAAHFGVDTGEWSIERDLAGKPYPIDVYGDKIVARAPVGGPPTKKTTPDETSLTLDTLPLDNIQAIESYLTSVAEIQRELRESHPEFYDVIEWWVIKDISEQKEEQTPINRRAAYLRLLDELKEDYEGLVLTQSAEGEEAKAELDVICGIIETKIGEIDASMKKAQLESTGV
jgi:hypothetical protein